MTEQEIFEGNALIAVFMGCELLDFPKTENYIGESWYCGDFLKLFDDRTPAKVRTELLKFHCDWNWIMPVVAKIRGYKVWRNNENHDEGLATFSSLSISIDFEGYNTLNHCIITGSITHCIKEADGGNGYEKVPMPQIAIHQKESDFKAERCMEPIFQAVVAFIKWINQNKKTEPTSNAQTVDNRSNFEKALEWWGELDSDKRADVEREFGYHGHDIGTTEQDVLYFYTETFENKK